MVYELAARSSIYRQGYLRNFVVISKFISVNADYRRKTKKIKNTFDYILKVIVSGDKITDFTPIKKC